MPLDRQGNASPPRAPRREPNPNPNPHPHPKANDAGCHKHERIVIIPLEPGCDALCAQFNPSQLQLDESAKWSAAATKKDRNPSLEYTSTDPRSLSMELFFDTTEEPATCDVRTDYVDKLTAFLRPPVKRNPSLHRPPVIELRWGKTAFRGVLESVSTKLTMFLADGTPIRATCSIKMMEVQTDEPDERPRNRVAPPPGGR